MNNIIDFAFPYLLQVNFYPHPSHCLHIRLGVWVYYTMADIFLGKLWNVNWELNDLFCFNYGIFDLKQFILSHSCAVYPGIHWQS